MLSGILLYAILLFFIGYLYWHHDEWKRKKNEIPPIFEDDDDDNLEASDTAINDAVDIEIEEYEPVKTNLIYNNHDN